MREALPLVEFATLVGAPVDEIESYRDHGLLDVERDGLFDDLDIVRLDTIRHYCDDGWTPETLAAGLAAGTVAGFFDDILFDASRTYSVEEAADAVGADPEVIRQLGIAFGFTAEMRDHDVAMLEMFKTIADSGLPVDAMLEGARVMGDSLRRIAETEVRLLHVHVHERLTAAGVADDEVTRQIFEIQEVLTPLLDPLIQHVHRHHLMAAIIEDVFMHLTSSRAVPTTLGSVQATIVFADVASFTELAETEGDEAAAHVLERLDAAVRALTLEHEGKFVKQLGDGFMLVFRKSSDAVQFAIDLQGVIARNDGLPSVRIGINTGSVLHRAGDYVGSAANIASRVTSVAMPDQILVTDTVVADARHTATRMESVGVRMLRGVDSPLALWRVVHGEEARDPVCGAEIVAAAAVRLRSGGRDLAFCSEDCLRAYIEDPARYAAN